jgi:fermentation-respiration switch protein FrsA (DUF1100 family)
VSQVQGVTVHKVSYAHGQQQMVGNLFLPPDFDKRKKYAAIVCTHPFGGVKEQASGRARHDRSVTS